jgi:signal transduction histidine kinase
MHNLLHHQLKKYFHNSSVPPEWQSFIDAVDETYKQFDNDRETLESSLALSSQEFTEQSKIEEHLRQVQKMEAVASLAGGIAHDFNNILTAIIGYGNLLKEGIQQESRLRGYLDQILLSAEKAAVLTQSLLAFSRRQIISPMPIDLNEIIRKLEILLARLIGEDIELKTALASGPLMIMADPGQIEQILMNLADNARNAMPDGGVLTLRTEVIDLDHEFIKSHGYGLTGTYAVMSIEDTGHGIDEQTRERIFEPFFTTKEVGKGTGLGLAMAYGIVTQHEGYINVYSEIGKGTIFKIHLPVIKSERFRSRSHSDISS